MLSTCELPNQWLMAHAKLEGISLMDHLYNRLNGIYPNKFRSNFKDVQAIQDWKDAWAEAFDEEGIVPQDVALGIKNCRRMFDWPPSLPEFLRACRPHLEADVAFFEAVRGMQARARGEVGTWSHPAIFHAAIAVGQYDMMNQAYQQLENRWSKALASQFALGAWADIPAPTLALPSPVDSKAVRAEGQKKVRDLTEQAVSQKEKDQKAWAGKILLAPKGRTLTVLNMARAAQGEVA
ncbi:replication protein P [Alcaligenes faecalis]|uniref:replication protein P n=1 Tax=Alcaligenes faecalis TaxID=511 RepID=UPI00122C20D5|nr:replication protein P [Alcaligenes faecalis]KAA1286949.1 hypothetical protein D7S43_08615 [Alcaligenes faecalis]